MVRFMNRTIPAYMGQVGRPDSCGHLWTG